MIKVSRTYDPHLIDAMMRLPYVWKEITDDSCQKDPGCVNIPFLVKECVNLSVVNDNDHGSDAQGVFVFIPKSPTSCEAHTMLTDRCRGSNALEAGKMAIEWIWANTNFTEVTSFTFSDRPQISWYMRMLGLVKTSDEDWPNTRDGKPVKVLRYSISKSK